MKTFFSRHTKDLDVDAATREYLWQQRLVTIHYPRGRTDELGEHDNSSLNPNDYSSRSGGVIRAFVELSQQGGYVCAQYHDKPDCLMGVVEPNTPIQLLSCLWGQKYGHVGRTAVLKTLPLSRVKVVNPSKHAMVLIGRPQQGTFMRWHTIGSTIEEIVEGRTTPLSIESLQPSQQEIMCGEFLRLPDASTENLPRLKHLLMPIGRTMKDIDIIALAEDGKRLLVQVTLKRRTQATEKLQRLAQYANKTGDHLVFFCDADSVEDYNGVRIYPIRKVFDRFTSTEAGKIWLNNAVHSWKNDQVYEEHELAEVGVSDHLSNLEDYEEKLAQGEINW